MDKHFSTFVRVRPFIYSISKGENVNKRLKINKNKKKITISINKNKGKGKRECNNYYFDGLFGFDDKTVDVFSGCVEPIVSHWIKGYNGTIFAYGQTGSGKTHTIHGSHVTDDSSQSIFCNGCVHLAGEFAFKVIENWRNGCPAKRIAVIKASYVEIYLEKPSCLLRACDLGDEGSCFDDTMPVVVREQKDGVFVVDGAREIRVKSPSDLSYLLSFGNQSRTTGNSSIHDHSSRSHSIFKLLLACVDEEGRRTVSELNFVDLAGSESLSYDFGPAQQTETKSINLSLLSLKTVFHALAEEKPFIPYRDSALTKLLQNSLGGNCISSLICTISPETPSMSVSESTLKFSQIARTIQVSMVKPNDHPLLCDKEKLQLSEMKIEVNINYQAKKNRKEEVPLSRELSSQSPISEVLFVPTSVGNLCCRISRKSAPQRRIAFVLHGFGKTAGKDDWSYLTHSLGDKDWFVVAPDMPGFGSSEGNRQSSRTEKLNLENGPVDTLKELIHHFSNNQSQVILLGYDWGAAIAISFAIRYPKIVSRVVAFHPSWTDTLVPLNSLSIKTLILWVSAEQLHPIACGIKMTRAMPTASFVKLDCGPFTHEKPKGTYRCIALQITKTILDWLPKNSEKKRQPFIQSVTNERIDEPTVLSEKKYLMETMDTEQHLVDLLSNKSSFGLVGVQKVKREQNRRTEHARQKKERNSPLFPSSLDSLSHHERCTLAVSTLHSLLISGQSSRLFSSAEDSLDAKRLLLSMPQIYPSHSNWDVSGSLWGCWPVPPRSSGISTIPRYVPGRQLILKLPVVASVLSPSADFLAYSSSSSDIFCTFRVQVESISSDSSHLQVIAATKGGGSSSLSIPNNQVYLCNQPTNFSGNPGKEGLLFEDGVRCKYSEAFTRAKFIEAALSIRHLVGQIDLNDDPTSIKGRNTTHLQLLVLETLQKNMNLTHFHHIGMDRSKKRTTKPDVGRLIHYGQGNCHTLASCMAALITPFSDSLGFEVRFRAGFVCKEDRDVIFQEHQERVLSPSWNGKPRQVEDHTWLEVTLIPSLLSFCVDPSHYPKPVPLAAAYSCFRQLPLVSEKLPCNSLPVCAPKCVHPSNSNISVPSHIHHEQINLSDYPIEELTQPHLVNWKKAPQNAT